MIHPRSKAVARALRAAVVAPLLLAFATGCGEESPSGPAPHGEGGARQVGVVLNSVDLSLTIFPADAPGDPSTVGLGADGSPVGFSARAGLAAVPMGIVPAVAVVDLSGERVLRTISLPDGSGATGSAFANDSVVVVANPGRNSVSPVNVLRDSVGEEVPVGVFPQEVVAGPGRLFVLNAELGTDFRPAGPGTITVLRASDLAVAATIQLSGRNPVGGVFGPDGRLHVVNSGDFGQGNGSLSVVDPVSLTEVAHHEGFGDFPGPPALGPAGLLYVPSFSYGVAVWDPSVAEFARSPVDPLTPGGADAVSAVAFDADGRLHVLIPRCSEPGSVLRLGADLSVTRELTVGTCPIRISFPTLPG